MSAKQKVKYEIRKVISDNSGKQDVTKTMLTCVRDSRSFETNRKSIHKHLFSNWNIMRFTFTLIACEYIPVTALSALCAHATTQPRKSNHIFRIVYCFHTDESHTFISLVMFCVCVCVLLDDVQNSVTSIAPSLKITQNKQKIIQKKKKIWGTIRFHNRHDVQWK